MFSTAQPVSNLMCGMGGAKAVVLALDVLAATEMATASA
jgi:hypothetical protein